MKLHPLADYVTRYEDALGTVDRVNHNAIPFMGGKLTMIHNGVTRPLSGIAGIYYFESMRRDDIVRAISACTIGLGYNVHKRIVKVAAESVGLLGFKSPAVNLNDAGELRVCIEIEHRTVRWNDVYDVAVFIATDDFARIEPRTYNPLNIKPITAKTTPSATFSNGEVHIGTAADLQ